MTMKHIDINEFRDSGLLQEVNRQFFHPRGLALEVLVCDGKATSLGGIQDFRDDPEGVWMPLTAEQVAKGITLDEDFRARLWTRCERLGWIIQPLVEQGPDHPKGTE